MKLNIHPLFKRNKGKIPYLCHEYKLSHYGKNNITGQAASY